MNEEREKVYQILELGKHIKNLHHKKGFGGLLFIDLSMIKFSKLSSYIRQLDKENEQLKDNWNKLKEYIRKNIIYDDVGMKILDPSPLEDYMQELEQGSDNQ